MRKENSLCVSESLEPVQEFLTKVQNEFLSTDKNQSITILELSVDQHGTVIEAGSTLSGRITAKGTGKNRNDVKQVDLSAGIFGDATLSGTPTENDRNAHQTRYQLKLKIEGTENCQTLHKKSRRYYYTGLFYERITTHRFFDATYELTEESLEALQGGTLRFQITIPEEMINSMPTFTPRRTDLIFSNMFGGQCGVSHRVTAILSIRSTANQSSHDGRKDICSQSIPLSFQQSRRACQPALSLDMGTVMKLPVTVCGIFTYAHRDSYTLQLSDKTASELMSKPIYLFPGQSLKLAINDTGNGREEDLLTDKVEKTVWKLTQRVKWTAAENRNIPPFAQQWRGSYTTDQFIDSWEIEVRSNGQVENNDKDDQRTGTIMVPPLAGKLRYTHVGKYIQVTHEMIVFTCDKNSTVLGSSPVMPVVLTPGYLQGES